ncbi:MAG: hypothetical protein ABJF50_02195 [Paracoccaceae bacterium]
MSDFTRLENVLAKLRQREKAGGEVRTLRGVGSDALLASLVAEIDETILPRRLIFTTKNGTELHMAVANRRLQSLLSPVPDLPGAKDLADVAFADGQDPNLALLGGMLRGIFEQAETVRIDARRLPAGAYDPDVGAPSGGLSKAWGVQVVEVRVKEPSEIIDFFLNQISDDDAEAWLRIEGENVTDQAGSAERLTELGEQAAVFLDGYFSKFDALFSADEAATATVVAPEAAGQTAVLFVEIGGLSAFVAAKTARVAALASSWQAQVSE